MMPPTHRQLQLCRFIAGFQLAHDRPPTYREMCTGVGLGEAHRSSMHRMASQLVERGLAERNRAGKVVLLLDPGVPFSPDGAPLFVVPGIGPLGAEVLSI